MKKLLITLLLLTSITISYSQFDDKRRDRDDDDREHDDGHGHGHGHNDEPTASIDKYIFFVFGIAVLFVLLHDPKDKNGSLT